MDPEIDKYLNQFVNKTLEGPGFIDFAPKEKEEFKSKLIDYFSELIFDTLLRNLSDAQMAELNRLPDLESEEAQEKIALMSATIPDFIFILQNRFEKASEEISRTGRIPEPQTTLPL